ncbi:MAG TPA: GNAT family N-acetyltransferase, partial [Thermoanaerobaculia bacterium]|nr:GNAT family N-acetyltransferase [Thermoanaerobaculia bacterium]
ALESAAVIRTACIHDLPKLRELFVNANDAPYSLAAVAEEKCFGHGVSGEPVVRVWGDFEGAAVTCGRHLRLLAVARASRRRGIGTALLKDAEERGANVIAAEAGNYFTPGVFDGDVGSVAFFRRHGYLETRFTHNLIANVGRASARPPQADGLKPILRRATAGEAEQVLDFIEKEFGRIWRFEAAKAFEEDPPRVFLTEEGGAITGFAVHDVNNRGLGFFGPTGVRKDQRGRGLGCDLLRASLADLRGMGYERAVIPWTDALEFYRKCSGALPAHRFVAFARPR